MLFLYHWDGIALNIFFYYTVSVGIFRVKRTEAAQRVAVQSERRSNRHETYNESRD